MNLLFDLDGTLTDPQLGILGCVRHALESMGVTVPPFSELKWVIGPPLQASLATLLGDRSSESAACLGLYRDRFSEVGLFENEVYDGVTAALAELSGHRLYVATSKPTVYSRRILDHFELSSHFVEVYGSELDGTRSDKTHLLAHLLLEEGLEAGETIMIGDREHDIVAARNNGLRSIGVLYGYGSAEEIRSAGPDLIAESPAEVVGCVGRMSK